MTHRAESVETFHDFTTSSVGFVKLYLVSIHSMLMISQSIKLVRPFS